MQNVIPRRVFILLIISYILFFLGNSLLSLTNPDEVFYALTAKEMMAKSEWATPVIFGQPHFEKPILTFWLLRGAFEAWGITPFAARFFPALFATLGVIGVYLFGLLMFKNERKAFLSAVILASSVFYIAMGKIILTDMIFAVFILFALLSFYWGFLEKRQFNKAIILFYMFCALATLTNGPLGLLIPQLIVITFLLYRRQISVLSTSWILLGLLVYLLIASPWFFYMATQHGNNFIHEFFYNAHWGRLIEAEHPMNDRWYFYPLTMMAGLFPWSLFWAGALVFLYKSLKDKVGLAEHFLLSWLLVVFIVFQVCHSKLATYILPVFPCLALLTAHFIEEGLNNEESRQKLRFYILMMAGFFVILGTGCFAFYDLYEKSISSKLPVYFLSGSLIALGGLIITLILKERYLGSLYMLSAVAGIILSAAFFMRFDIEAHVSSHEAAQYLPHRLAAPTVILSSKPYSLGVRLYTGQDIAVWDLNGKNNLSSHPIPIITNHEILVEFLKAQRVTFAVLKEEAYQQLVEKVNHDFKVDVLRKTAGSYVLKIEVLGDT